MSSSASADTRARETTETKTDDGAVISNAPSNVRTVDEGDRALDGRARAALLTWYDGNKRSLPWRRACGTSSRRARTVTMKTETDADAPTREEAARAWRERAFERGDEDASTSNELVMGEDQYAYGVLVSEIMSQQTQIERVAEYWTRWVARWPNAAALASATQEEVNEEWAGLGYYRRAGFLLKGAKYVSEELGGRYPRSSTELLKIPGVGPYTASAVASIAFGERTAAVDGNVHRVLTRVKVIKGDPTKGETAKEIRKVADEFVDAERPGDFNQAMMELGATVCTPTNPKCAQCPIASWCGGLEKERSTSGVFKVTDLPETAKKAEKRQEQRAFVVIRRGSSEDGYEYLMAKRPEGGLLSGLWEFPNSLIACENDDVFATRPKSHVLEAQNALCAALGARESRRVDAASGKVAHIFSHVRQVMHYQLIDLATSENLRPDLSEQNGDFPDLRWFPALSFEESGVFSSGVAKVYAKVVARADVAVRPSGSQKRKLQEKSVKSTDEASDATQRSIKSFFAAEGRK